MSINKKDDYDKLAELLYPSIESSGSLYYGQTKKLAVDELFDKNNGGFSIHYSPNSSDRYITEWSLGPFHDKLEIPMSSIKDTSNGWLSTSTGFLDSLVYIDRNGNESLIHPGEDLAQFHAAFAKYDLIINTVKDTNIINSGEINSYHKEILCKFNCFVLTENGASPLDHEDLAFGRSFILGDHCIYIQVFGAKEPDIINTSELEAQPLTITSASDEICQIYIEIIDPMGAHARHYPKYYVSVNDGDARAIVFSITPPYRDMFFLLGRNSTAKLWIDNSVNYDQFEGESYHLNITSTASVELSGNICSLLDGENYSEYKSTLNDNAFYKLFADAANIVNASKLVIPDVSIGYNSCNSMFINCTNLNDSPIMKPKYIHNSCYANMFYGCTLLSEVYCYAINRDDDSCTSNWLYGTYSPGKFYGVPFSNFDHDSYDGIPIGWTAKNDIESYYYSDSFNLRYLSINGDVTNYNIGSRKYKDPFEDNYISQNSVNESGSVNQQIYGYKKFMDCSSFIGPVFIHTTSDIDSLKVSNIEPIKNGEFQSSGYIGTDRNHYSAGHFDSLYTYDSIHLWGPMPSVTNNNESTVTFNGNTIIVDCHDMQISGHVTGMLPTMPNSSDPDTSYRTADVEVGSLCVLSIDQQVHPGALVRCVSTGSYSTGFQLIYDGSTYDITSAKIHPLGESEDNLSGVLNVQYVAMSSAAANKQFYAIRIEDFEE